MNVDAHIRALEAQAAWLAAAAATAGPEAEVPIFLVWRLRNRFQHTGTVFR